jgi:hypothetical protein
LFYDACGDGVDLQKNVVRPIQGMLRLKPAAARPFLARFEKKKTRISQLITLPKDESTTNQAVSLAKSSNI